VPVGNVPSSSRAPDARKSPGMTPLVPLEPFSDGHTFGHSANIPLSTKGKKMHIGLVLQWMGSNSVKSLRMNYGERMDQ